MKLYLPLIVMFLFASLTGGCNLIRASPTPLPGWRSPVYELLVDDSAFPQDWTVEFPQDTSIDPTANHVWRIWGHMSGSKAVQSIWRAYSITDAQKKYEDLQSQFHLSPPPEPDAIFIEPKPPTAISFQSQVADEMYLACGWDYIAYCVVVVRYRNYVTNIRMDLQAEHEGIYSDGLTYEQIEKIVMAMDSKFVEFSSKHPVATSTP